MSEYIAKEQMDPAWQAMLEGRYEDALQVWNTMIQRDGSAMWQLKISRGITLLLLGDTQAALADFMEYRDAPYPGKWPVPLVGTALWLLGRREEACKDWAYEISRRRSGELTHYDEGGGVEVPALLWWASAHEGMGGWRKLAVDELRERDKSNRRRKDHHPGPLRRWERWPGVLASFLLGTSTEEALLPHLRDLSPFMAAKRCRAHFFLGARHLDAGDLAGYRRELELAVGQGENSIQEPEYHLTRAELLTPTGGGAASDRTST